MEQEHPDTEHEVAKPLVDQLMEAREQSERDKPFGLYIVEPPEPGVEVAKDVELAVFDREFGNGAEVIEREYNAYEAASTFLVVIDQRTKRPAGMLRVIKNSPSGLKSINDLQYQTWHADPQEVLQQNGLAFDMETTWDVATVAVLPEYENSVVAPALFHELYRLSRERGVREWVTIMDSKIRDTFQTRGQLFDTYDGIEPGEYLGSEDSLPMHVALDDFEQRAREHNPVLASYLLDGQRLSRSVSLPTEAN